MWCCAPVCPRGTRFDARRQSLRPTRGGTGMTSQAEWLSTGRGRAAANGARQAPHRYLLISSNPRPLAELVASLWAQPAEVTVSFPTAADRHRVLALRPDVVLVHVGD